MESLETPAARTIWYVVWSAMFLFAAAQSLLPHPVFSGGVDFGIGVLLAVIACAQLLVGGTPLPRKRAALSAVVLLTFCAAQVVQFARSTQTAPQVRGVDFSAYYIAAKVISERQGESIYQLPLFADGRMNLNVEVPASSPWHAAAVRHNVPFSAPYIYPPLVAVLMRPMARLSFGSAYLAWSLLSVLLVAIAMLLSLSLGAVSLDAKLALLLGVGLFSYYPFLDNLFFGQIGGVILFLLAASIWLLARSHTSLSALCFALATLIKLTPVMAIPVFVFHRRWKWLFAYCAWMAGLLIFSIWQAGWPAHQQFWREVLPRISSGAPIDHNFSIVAWVQELFMRYVPRAKTPPLTIPRYAAPVSRLMALLVYLLLLARLYMRRRDGSLVRDLVVTVLLGIVLSPITWAHHYVIGLMPFIYLWCKGQRTTNGTLLAVFLAVGTNIIGILELSATNPVVQLVLAVIVPGLTIALALAREPREAGSPGAARMVDATAYGEL